MRGSRAYLRIFAVSTLLLCVSLIGFNFLMDPYGIYRVPDVRGVNAVKPQVHNRLDLHKLAAVERVRPATLVLGNSRAEFLDPDHPGWGVHPVYNLALPGADIARCLQLMSHALSVGPLRQVVLGTDLRSFRPASTAESGNLRRSLRRGAEHLQVLISVDTLFDSFRTIGGQDSIPMYLPNGQHNGLEYWRDIQDLGGHRAAFLSAETLHLRNTWKELRDHLAVADGGIVPLDLEPFRAMVDAAYRHDVDLRVFLPPLHARLWEAMDAAGLWETFEELKRQLVRITEEEAAKRQAEPFGVWDFSGYSRYTTEPVPPLHDDTTRMAWHWESSHYQATLGDLVLDVVLGRGTAGSAADDLGMRLTSANVEQHLAGVREDRARYRIAMQEDVREILELAGIRDE